MLWTPRSFSSYFEIYRILNPERVGTSVPKFKEDVNRFSDTPTSHGSEPLFRFPRVTSITGADVPFRRRLSVQNVFVYDLYCNSRTQFTSPSPRHLVRCLYQANRPWSTFCSFSSCTLYLSLQWVSGPSTSLDPTGVWTFVPLFELRLLHETG